MLRSILTVALTVCASMISHSDGQTNIRFHNESSDTTRINEILIDASVHDFNNPSERAGYIARKFIGTPYVAHTLEAEQEELTVNIDELDCTTFVETVLAMAYTVGEGRTSWRDFTYNLERIRYRNGEINGYASRLHYICDWVVDNVHRGNFEDATRNFPHINYVVRTIDFMSSHRGQYPALKDSAEFARIKDVEIGYRSHRFPYVKSLDLDKKATKAAFRDGDAVALVCSLKDLDVTHMGFVVKIDGEPYLLHASSTNGKVEISAKPLDGFIKKNRSLIGVRVIRLKE